MKGYLCLEGGAEFGGRMAAPDRRAIELAGGWDVPIAIIPTAAAPDNNHQRAGQNGVRWFESLGARQVELLMLTDPKSAQDEGIAAALTNARLIYLLGGFPRYLGETLAGSLAWQAMQTAYHSGAVIAGSSAGAMVLCQQYYDPDSREVLPGLGLLPNSCVLPHHNSFGKQWAALLSARLPESVLIGIDEQTGMLDDGPAGAWNIYGNGAVTLYREGKAHIYHPGSTFSIP